MYNDFDRNYWCRVMHTKLMRVLQRCAGLFNAKRWQKWSKINESVTINPTSNSTHKNINPKKKKIKIKCTVKSGGPETHDEVSGMQTRVMRRLVSFETGQTSLTVITCVRTARVFRFC